MQKKYSILKFYKVLIPMACFAFSNMVFAQPLVLNNSPYIVLNGGNVTTTTPIYLVINYSSSVGISSVGTTGGGIQSEGEYNYVEWNIGTASGTYKVPFYDPNSTYRIPFSMSFNAGHVGGSATGHVLFSTYHTGNDNKNGSGNYASYDGGTHLIPNLWLENTNSDNSAYVVDRWWIVDASSYDGSYTTFTNHQDAITFSFSFPASELNSAALANLDAQPFEYDGSTKWNPGIVFPGTTHTVGTPDIFSNTPVGNTVPCANFYRAWVLVDNTKLLPIELLSFNAVCESNKVNINWATASETNNNYFTIERSKDLQTWETVTAIPGAGNSNTVLHYSAIDNQPFPDYTYYRLKQTDYNGNFTYSDVVIAGCGNTTSFDFISVNQSKEFGDMVLSFTAGEGELYTCTLYDIRGRLLQKKSAQAVAGINEVNVKVQGMSNGIYILILQNDTKLISKKIFISDQY